MKIQPYTYKQPLFKAAISDELKSKIRKDLKEMITGERKMDFTLERIENKEQVETIKNSPNPVKELSALLSQKFMEVNSWDNNNTVLDCWPSHRLRIINKTFKTLCSYEDPVPNQYKTEISSLLNITKNDYLMMQKSLCARHINENFEEASKLVEDSKWAGALGDDTSNIFRECYQIMNLDNL